jgi:uncharacterized protein (DUF849 family)
VWLVERWDVLPDFASVNLPEEGVPELVDALLRRRIGVEAGLVDPADGDRAATLAETVDEALDRAGVEVPRVHHAGGIATWTVLERAIERGRDVRVGLEDTLVLPDGRPARDNADLVRAAVRTTRRERAG